MATSNVTLRQLRYFVAAARNQQFSMAASSENVSQSAITNAVLALEKELGVRLFERLAQGVSLTADGQDFFHHACHILDSVHDATHKPRFRSAKLRGTVSVAASYTVLGYFLPDLLARFRASYPDVEIDLRDMSRSAIEQGVLDGEVELGVLILSNIPRPQRFEHAVLVRSRRQLWVAPGHPLARLASPSLKDIAQHPYIMMTADEAEDSTLAYWKSRRMKPNTVFRTMSMEAVRGLVAHGFGVTALSDMVFRPWSLEGKRIEARPILDPVPPMEVGVIWRTKTSLSAPAEALQQFLLHAYGY